MDMFKCRICGATYNRVELLELRKTSPMYNGWRQFLPCTHEFSSLEQVTAACHQCGKVEDKVDMWDDGTTFGCAGSVTLYLCQDCHEGEVDADFWEVVTGHASY